MTMTSESASLTGGSTLFPTPPHAPAYLLSYVPACRPAVRHVMMSCHVGLSTVPTVQSIHSVSVSRWESFLDARNTISGARAFKMSNVRTLFIPNNLSLSLGGACCPLGFLLLRTVHNIVLTAYASLATVLS